MKLYFSYLVLLFSGLHVRVWAQGQIITPDNQTLSFQTVNATSNLVISHNTSYNTFIGSRAGQANTTGSQNAFLGAFAGQSNTTANGNAFIGYRAGFANTTGTYNAFIGFQAGQANTTGYANAFIGFGAGQANSTGANNSFIGNGSGYTNTTGNDNAFIGTYAGYTNTTGNDNAFIGHATGTSNTTGNNNAFIGAFAGYYSTTGTGNAYIGNRAGQNTTTGNGNAFVGDGSGYGTTTGGQNTYLGQNAGYTGNATGTNNVFIGYGSGVNAAATVVSNAAAIGANAIVTQSNSVVLGGMGASSVNVGIGNTAPSAKLHITTGVANSSGLRLENLTSSSPATAFNQYKFLSVDGSGNVILASVNGSAREAAPEALWQRKGLFLENTKGEAVIIGQGVSKTLGEYNLFVSKGILTEKVKVAIRNTSEWSDKVFEKGYKLKSLGEVNQYIQAHNHLPGIPSAKEMVKRGNDLHQTDAKLLEKIEELTLYSIQQEQKLQLMEQKQAQLEKLIIDLIKARK